MPKQPADRLMAIGVTVQVELRGEMTELMDRHGYARFLGNEDAELRAEAAATAAFAILAGEELRRRRRDEPRSILLDVSVQLPG